MLSRPPNNSETGLATGIDQRNKHLPWPETDPVSVR
jgi:hypothetical protein